MGNYVRVASKNGNQGNGGGQKPRILTEEEIKKVEELAPFLTVSQLGDYLKICYNTFKNVMKRQPEVGEIYKKSRSKKIQSSVKTLFEIMSDNTIDQRTRLTAVIFHLKTQGGWRETDKRDPRVDVLCEKMGINPDDLD